MWYEESTLGAFATTNIKYVKDEISMCNYIHNPLSLSMIEKVIKYFFHPYDVIHNLLTLKLIYTINFFSKQ
jgi:hypothetical protein